MELFLRRDLCIIGRQIIKKIVTHYEVFHDPKAAAKMSPKWMLKLWNSEEWDSKLLTKIIELTNTNSLRMYSSGTIRDQWGSYYFCISTKTGRTTLGERTGPVHGNRDQIKKLRAEATFILTLLSILHQLQPFTTNTTSTVIIHTRSQGLFNKALTRSINRPSLVTSNHIYVIYQIRHLLEKNPLDFQFINTHAAPKEVNIKLANKKKQLKDLKLRQVHSGNSNNFNFLQNFTVDINNLAQHLSVSGIKPSKWNKLYFGILVKVTLH